MADIAALTVSIVGQQTVTPAANAAVSALNSVESAAGRTVGAFTSMAAAAAKASAAMIAVGAGAAAALGGNAIKVAADFEQQLSAIAAVSSKAEVATVGGLKAIGDAALQLGKDTSFSATEAAAGMEEMVKAGVSLTDVMGGGAKAALDLAAAGAIEVSEAATIASNAMNAFALSGKDLPNIVDTLANAANASATDIHQLGFALASVGAVAHGIGLSLEDTTTAVALLAQAGLKGSDAGTSLKTMLLNLSPSTKVATAEMEKLGIITVSGARSQDDLVTALKGSEAGQKALATMQKNGTVTAEGLWNAAHRLGLKSVEGTKNFTDWSNATANVSNQFFDAQGNTKSMAEIAGVLQHATANLTKEQKINALQTIFGSDAIRAATILAEQGAEGINQLTEAEKAVGGASAVAKERLNNLKGALEQLGGSWEVIRIKIGTPFLPILTRGAQALTKALNDAEPAISAFAEKAAAGLDRMIQRATAAAPRFLALGSGLLAFGQQGLVLAQNVLPALTKQVTAFVESFNLGGIGSGASSLAGGLIGAFRQIEPVVMTVGRAIVTNITTTFDFLVNRVLPPVVSIIQQIGTVLERTLLPAAARTGQVMRGIFGDTLDWLAKTVMPPFLSIVEQTTNFWTQVMLPTLPAVSAALRTALGETVQWLATDVWPKLRVAAEAAWGFISGTIVPAIPGLVRSLRELLGGALEWLGTTGWPLLVKGATTVWKFLQDNVIPVVKDTYDWLKVKLPEAINTVVSTFETIKGKVGPIVEAALNGDILAAIRNLGSAFGEFATLAAGWLGEQAAKIDWAAVWSQTKDVAVTLGTYLLGQAVDFATWLGEQVATIPWASVWQRTVEAATALLTYLKAQAIDFATWLGAEVAKIPWATVWQQTKDAAVALATYLQGLTVDFATWLGAQVASIDWAAVWVNVKLTGKDIIDAIAAAVGAFDQQLSTWLDQQITAIDWKGLGASFGKFIGEQMLTNTQTAVDAIGPGLKRETLAKALGDFFVGTIMSLDAVLTKAYIDMMNSALDKAMRAVTPTRPSWWPASVPWPFGPQANSGQQFPVGTDTSVPSGGQPGAPGRSTASPLSSKESMIARAKQLATERGLDPELFAAQLMQESSFDPTAFAENNQGGARGIGQFIPSTGTAYATKLGVTYEQMVNDADLSMQAAAMHMRDLTDQFGGSQERALSAYFAGPGGGVQPGYVSAVRGRLPQVQGIPAASGATTQMAQPVGSGGGEGMVTYRDEWGNEYTVTESQFATRQQVAHGTNPVTVVGRQAAAGAGQGAAAATQQQGTTASKPLYVLPIAGMGPAQPHWGSDVRGTDIMAPEGTPVQSIAAGKVLSTTTTGPGGNSVLIQGADGKQYYYAHLKDAANVVAGQTVDAGTLLGGVGSTGNAAGGPSHLHLGIGESILNGVGPAGGVGSEGNAVQFLNDIRDGKYQGPIQATTAAATDLAVETTGATDATANLGSAMGNATPPTEAQGAAIATTGSAAAALPEQVQTAADGTTAATEMVTASFDLMRAGTLQSVTDMGAGTLTTTSDMAGNTVATVTDMSGQVTAQSATLANGVSLNIADMNTQTTTSVDEMAGTITTTMTGVNGDSVSTVTDMKGKVVGQFTTMKTDAGSAVATMAAKSKEEFSATGKSATEMGQTVVEAGQSLKQIPQANMQDTVKQFGAVAEAAKKAQKAIKDLADASEDLPGSFGGSKSGSGKSSGLGKKAAGGWTVPGQTTLVGELGPELISTDRPMYVNTAGETRQMMGGGTRTTVNNFYGVLPESMLDEADRRKRMEDILYRIGG